MELKMNNCERLGVNPKWTKLKTVVDSKKKDNPLFEDDEINFILKYTTRTDMFDEYPNVWNITEDSSEVLGKGLCENCLISALQDQPWLPELSK